MSTPFEKYCEYVKLRDIVALKRIKGEEITEEYFKDYPSCQNRRYMDRESQYYIQNRIDYKGNYPITDAIFQLIFRKDSTYKFIKDKLNDYPGNFVSNYVYIDLIKVLLEDKKSIFTGAYLIPNRGKFNSKVEAWLNLFKEYNFEKDLSTFSLADDAFKYFKQIKGFGDFLSSQFVAELSWLNETKFTYTNFVEVGNGAFRGLNKLGIPSNKHKSFLIELTNNNNFENYEWLPLYPMDLQNTFCEFDKWSRLSGEFNNGGRSRMKRHRIPKKNPITNFVITEKMEALKW